LKILENYSTEPYAGTKWPADLEFELEEEVDADKRGPYNWQSEDEKVIRDKKARRDDDVPSDVLKLLGKDGLRVITQLINNIYETGVYPRDFSEVTMTTWKKPKATKCSNYHTSSLITHTEKDSSKDI
jgi:hypothetical protein